MTRLAPFIGSPLFGGHLRDPSVESGNIAEARFMRTIGGNNRLYYELIKGSTLTDQTACAPLNARGLLGEDHSGGAMGRPIRHTYWSMCFADDDSSTTDEAPHPPAIYTDGSSTPGRSWGGVHYVFVPACMPGGAYSTALVDASVLVSDVADGDTCEITLTVNGVDYEMSFDLSSLGYVSDSVSVEVIPGTYNAVTIAMTATLAALTDVSVVALSFSQPTGA